MGGTTYGERGGGGGERTMTATLPWADANGAAARARVMSLFNMVLVVSLMLGQWA